MAIDCSQVPTNISYDCVNQWGNGCENKAGFDFKQLWIYTQNIQKACPTDPRLFGHFSTPQNASLTPAACIAMAGKGWQYYPGVEIWSRVTNWKLPLLQLVVSLPRPPLSTWVEWFVILHLLGDPIDTIRNLLLKLSICDRVCSYWITQLPRISRQSFENEPDRDWKALTIVVDAYDEWGKGKLAIAALHRALSDLRDGSPQKAELRQTIHETACTLAADRATKFLPIVVAQSLFIGATAIATARTAAAAKVSPDTLWINLEAHGIAYSAQYFWVIPAVFLGSVIGVSQTRISIPRILLRFQEDLNRLRLPKRVQLPNDCLDNDQGRKFCGGIYSWQPTRWQWTASGPPQSMTPGNLVALNQQPNAPRYHPVSQDGVEGTPDLDQGSRCERLCLTLAAYLMVITGTMIGMIISGFVPPEGWDCRHNGEILILLAWILSAVADNLLGYLLPQSQTWLFSLTFIKDLILTVATLGGVMTTMFGVFHRCDCYTLWGNTGLALPQMPDVADKLRNRINTLYPGLTFGCIGIELLLIPLVICFCYRHAIRVFVQRDDGASNAIWFWKLYDECHNLRLRRSGTLSYLEQGTPNDVIGTESTARNTTAEPDAMAADDQQLGHAGTGADIPAPARPRRRVTEPQGTVLGASARLAQSNNKALHRKPLPPHAQLQG